MNTRTLEIYEGEKRNEDDVELTSQQAETLKSLQEKLDLKPKTPTVGRKYLEQRVNELKAEFEETHQV